MPFRYLLKDIEFVFYSYHIFIAYMSLGKWGPIVNQYTLTVRNRFDTLQEILERHITNMETEAVCIPMKSTAKCWVPGESLVVRKKMR